MPTVRESPELKGKEKPPAHWSACLRGWWACLDAKPRIIREEESLFTLASVVGIDEVELKWRLAMYLHDDLAAGHSVVVHVGIEKS